jgi:hypothetical protein
MYMTASLPSRCSAPALTTEGVADLAAEDVVAALAAEEVVAA